MSDSQFNTILERLEVIQKNLSINSIAIASSTNAAPVVITFATPHNFVEGDTVTVKGHLINTNANGTWRVNIASPTSIVLLDSSGNGVGGATGNASMIVQNAWGYEPSANWASIANLPFCANTLVGGGPTNFTATALQWVDSTVRMNLCIGMIDKGLDVYKLQKNTYRWRDAVFALFIAHLKLSDPNTPNSTLDYVMEASITHWDIVPLEFDTGAFAALAFDLSIKERYPLTVGL